MLDLYVLALVLTWDDDVDVRSGDMDGEGTNLGEKWMDLGVGDLGWRRRSDSMVL